MILRVLLSLLSFMTMIFTVLTWSAMDEDQSRQIIMIAAMYFTSVIILSSSVLAFMWLR